MSPSLSLSIVKENRRPPSPSAEDALKMLELGNLSYRGFGSSEVDESRRAPQRPTATVVTCSYLSPTVITHTVTHGKMFVVTSSGHLASDKFLASIEYGVAHLHTPAIFVVSHRCQRSGECRRPYLDGDKLRGSYATSEEVERISGTQVQILDLGGIKNGLPQKTMEHDLGTVLEILKIPQMVERVNAGTLAIFTAFYDDSTGKLWPTSKLYKTPSSGGIHPGEQELTRLCEGNGTWEGIFKKAQAMSADPSNMPLVAMVLACSDSREVPELMFHVPILGSLEVVRNAGASPDDNALRSLAICHRDTGVNLLVIKPHSRCGAIEAARKITDDGSPAEVGSPLHLTRMIAPHLDVDGWAASHPLQPATPQNDTARNLETFEAARIHGLGTLRDLFTSSNPDAQYLTQQVRDGKLRIVVGVAGLGSGTVDFIKDSDIEILKELDQSKQAVANG